MSINQMNNIWLKKVLAFFVIMIITYQGIIADSCLYRNSNICTYFDQSSILRDTFPLNQTLYGSDTYNPFDVLPTAIEDKVDYDPNTGHYIIYQKVGEEYFSAPTYMTFSEFAEYKNKKLQQQQFSKRNGSDFFEGKALSSGDPIESLGLNKKLQDRLFGSTEIDIRPVGGVDLALGVTYNGYSGAGAGNLPLSAQSNVLLLLDPNINIGVQGKVGDKMDLDFKYNTQATFDFQNQIKLQYTNEDAGEDDILRSIEAGDVSLPLNSNLIQGAESLFGLKTQLQFGKLHVTGLVSQQRSEQKSIKIENGSTIQEFELRTREYDENRHFFLSHYFRDNFERALSNLPQVSSPIRVTNVEVWVSLLNSDTRERAQTVVGITDFGEGMAENITSTAEATLFSTNNVPTNNIKQLPDGTTTVIPSNNNTPFFQAILDDKDVRISDQTTRKLEGAPYNLRSGKDFDKTDMRRLNPSEYTLNEQLGYISLNIRLRPNQALGISYEYTYIRDGEEVYRVGEISNSVERSNTIDSVNFEPDNVIFVKLLKPQIQTPEYNQNTGQAESKIWDLMMKNVYSLPTGQLSSDDFQFDIFYEDPSDATTFKRFIPNDNSFTPLLQLFQLDRLSRSLDPQADGVFDYLSGITVIPRTASIVFPVLEPFGRSLIEQNPTLYGPYAFQSLYENTVTAAQDSLFQDRFIMKGQVKSNYSDEINLNAFNIPRGSVSVYAGAQKLKEGIDYEIDYGIGRIKILNPSFLQSGVPLDVRFEDQSLFSLQQKTMFGLRADYKVNKNLTLGATYLHLFERPFTQKVNTGEDPINNKIYGFDVNYTKESPVITNLVDKLPFHSTNSPSTVNFSAEIATLKPGQSKAIRGNCAYRNFYEALDPDYKCPNESVVSIDDFEGASTVMSLQNPLDWKLASVPKDPLKWPEILEPEPLVAGYNRALFNWYRIENQFSGGALLSAEDRIDPYTRQILINELFPNQQIDNLQTNVLFTFDLSYYPEERGPYNYEGISPSLSQSGNGQISAGINTENSTPNSIVLNEPNSRWGGIMSYLPNNDFEAANFQYIEFWMLNPFMERRDSPPPIGLTEGELVFHLGNVSEDILPDNLQFFENAIPGPDEVQAVKSTPWARVPISPPQAVSFDNNLVEIQDLGLDGLNDSEELNFFSDYVEEIQSIFSGQASTLEDPANDNFISYLDEEFYAGETNLLNKFKRFNGFQNNVPTGDQRLVTGNSIPDSEDLNGNRGLDQAEGYYEYRIPLRGDRNGLDLNSNTNLSQFVTDIREIEFNGSVEKWYRFRIPIQEPFQTGDFGENNVYNKVGEISGFRSIQFVRMIARNFDRPVTMRLAEFEIARNQWRPLNDKCTVVDDNNFQIDETAGIQIDEVSFEENGSKLPFPYVSPDGIQREIIAGSIGNILQNEAALKLNTCLPISNECDPQVFRLTNLDLRFFQKLQMYIHAELDIDQSFNNTIEDDAVSVFIRIGKDFSENYYEYEVPLKFSENVDSSELQKFIVWPFDNFVNFELSEFTNLKLERNQQGLSASEVYEKAATINPEHKVKIKGTPTLGYLKGISIGIKNNSDQNQCVEVWINELRLAGLDNDGGSSGLARLQIDMADFGDFTMAGQFSTVGWGALNQRVFDRSLESVTSFDISTNLALEKLLPQKLNLSIPFYAQYSKEVVKHKFDQYELDLTIDEVQSYTDDPIEKQEVDDRSSQQTTIKAYNFTNVRKLPNKNKKGSSKPWDISNVGISYSHSITEYKDDIYRSDFTLDETTSIDYRYSTKPKYIEPLKFIKSDALRFLSSLNFNIIPSQFSFSTKINRVRNEKQYRLPNDIAYVFNDQKWDWDRRYNLNWDLARNLRLNFVANNYSVIDELKQVGVAPTKEQRTYVDVFGSESDPETGESFNDLISADPKYGNKYAWNNVKNGGRNKNYDHSLTIGYTLPFKSIQILNWINAQATYRAGYRWNGASLNVLQLGNVIQNEREQALNSTLSFDRLYDKVPYLKRLNGNNSRSRDDAKALSTLEKILVRPLLSIQTINVDYTVDENTIIPGFTPEPNLLGLSGGFDAPGFGFVLGSQPDLDVRNSNWVKDNASNWLTRDPNQFQPVIQDQNKSLNATINLEPYRDFKIDLDFRKSVSENYTQNIFFENNGFNQQGLYEVGSIRQTYFSLPTLFSDVNDIFDKFSDSRQIVSNYLGDQIGAAIDSTGYSEGYGRSHIDVVLNAFLNTYNGNDLTTLTNEELGNRINSYFDNLKSTSNIPAPNWNVRYNGLSKIEAFKNVFKNVSLSHAYSSDLTINQFKSDLEYRPGAPRLSEQTENQNYIAEYNIPQVSISERFDPIIGIDLQTISDISFTVSYSKQRTLTLETQSLNQLAEQKNTAFTVGMGFIKTGVELFGSKKNREKSTPDLEEEGNTNRVSSREKELAFNLDIQFRDDVSLTHVLDNQRPAEKTRGGSTLSISPQMTYVLNQYLELSAFVNYNSTKQKLTDAPDNIRVEGGVRFKFNLQ